MTIASGLGATWGFAEETTYGTFKAPDHFLQVESDKVKGSKKTVQSASLHGGPVEQASRRRVVFKDAKGPVALDLTDAKLGLLLKHMIGSSATAVQQGATTAYLQQHVPGDFQGLGLSLQSGRPDITGTVNAFSYAGAKVIDWEIAVSAAQLAKFSVTFDAVSESTVETYTAPSYTSMGVLSFVDASLLLGGTVTSVAGVVTGYAGGAAPVGTVKSVSLKGANAMAVDREQIGSLVKSQPIEDNWRKITGSMTVEFANLTEIYDLYNADTQVSLELKFQGELISGSYYKGLTITCPAVFLDGEPPETDGPKILELTVPFTVLDDGTNPVIEFDYMSTDIAL